LPNVALLGLGIMGYALAERLLDRGLPLTVWNRTPAKGNSLLTRGARRASTPADAVQDADIVALCLTDQAAVETVLFGEDGAAGRLPGASIIVDFSTLGIEPTRDLAARAGVAWVDAPVSGGPSAARAGTLAVFCGGADEAIARATPVLDAVSRIHTHMGTVGAGQATKLCNQLIVSTAMIAIAEAIVAAKAFGLKAELLPQALAGGYADSAPLQIFGPRMASQALAPRISEVATMRKDVKALARALGDRGLDLRLARATEAIYDLAMERGLGHEDLGALARLAEPV
jgi:3-hydroxyisobutyrate dehydrogenase/2-hydroxy-3-oxopropionate reductase